MGMFDYVKYECDCPRCGATVDGFQSKSGDCRLATVPPTSVDYFYSICGECGLFLDYVATQVPVYTQFKLVTREYDTNIDCTAYDQDKVVIPCTN